MLQSQYKHVIQGLGQVGTTAQGIALGRLYQVFRTQASMLAFTDVFRVCAILAFAAVPLALLFSATKRSTGPAPGAA